MWHWPCPWLIWPSPWPWPWMPWPWPWPWGSGLERGQGEARKFNKMFVEIILEIDKHNLPIPSRYVVIVCLGKVEDSVEDDQDDDEDNDYNN